VTYPDPLTWIIKDGTPATGDVRTQTIHFINETFFEFSGQSTAHLFASSLDLAAFNGQTATYLFNYSENETISKNCDDKFSGATTKTRFLNSVTQPDGSNFAFTYNKIEHDPATGTATCSLSAGHLLKLSLPTGGSIGYTLGQRRFPTYPDELEKGIPGTWRDHSASVETRTLVDANNAPAGTWTYRYDLTDPAFFHHPPNDTTELEKQGLSITVKDPMQRTTVYYYSVDHFGPGMDQSCYTNAVEELEYAMPFTRTSGTSTADGLLLSSEVYDSPCTLQFPPFGTSCTRTCLDTSNTPVQPSRSTYVQYELEAGPTPGDQNRRVRKSRTVFNNDTGCSGACYEETEFGDFDGLGHYRTATHRSNFPSTVPRVTTTHFNARGGTYVPGGGSSPDAYMILPASPWLPGVYDFQTTAESVQTARSEFCFNGTTGFLERRRTWRTGDRTKDLLATFEQAGGNVTAELYFGGDSQPLSAGFVTCTSDPGSAPTYRLTHHYSAGSVDSTQYDGVSFRSLDLTIDSNTGLASTSRDVSVRLATTYTYDTMQRLTEVHPPGEAWTKYTYTFGTPSSVSIIRRPFGSGPTASAKTSNFLYFDAFGRSVLSKEQFPEGWSSSKTEYDILGRAVSTSMPEFRGNSSWESFSPSHSTTTTFDRFDRPLSITMADTRATTYSYTGNRVTARTACVSAIDSLAPCPSGERPFTTTETVDGHGRLASVTEPLGNGLTTTYGYDVGNRLTSVSTSAPEGVQHRTFTYDLAGFLIAEQHPEKGINGNGTVSYTEYDARGHLRHRVDGTTGGSFDTRFDYDASERLTHVKDLDPLTQNRRDLKVFDYGTDNPSDNPRLGKLQTATRHNYQPTLGGDIAVAETYTYGGLNGRVTARATSISGALPANTFTLGQAWDDLGNIASITYPTNTALTSTPPRTIIYSYTNALLTGINSYVTSMTHLPNGLVGHIGHQNGENEDWNADPSGMSRPLSIHLTSNFGADKLIGSYSYDSTGNIKQIGDTGATHTIYQYDGAGRLAGSIASTPPSLSNTQTFTYDSFGNKTSVGSAQPRRFDPNGDGVINASDIFYLINFLFLSGPQPRGPAGGLLSGDANSDGVINASDIFFVVNFLFLGGPSPSVPTESLPSGELIPVDANAADSITVGTVGATGNTVDVPVYIRDLSGTPLGRDQATGSKIQSLSIKVAYSPASSVSAVTFTRTGITSGLSPTAAFSPSTTSSVSLVDTFQESSSLIPFTLNASAPGDLVAHLVFTLNGSASPGSAIAITLDPSVTLLSDEGGNTSESPANGTLALVDGAINIPLQMTTIPGALTANTSTEAAPRSIKILRTPKPAIFLDDRSLAASASRFAPRFSSSFTGTTNHDAAFAYDEAGDVLHDDTGRSFTYDALSMTIGATVPLPNNGTRNFAYIYTADDERIALVEKLSSGATTTNWTLRGLDNHLLRTWTNSSTSGWNWREDEVWRGGSLLAYESASGVRHYGLDHLGSPAILTDATGHQIGTVTFDAFGNGGATGAGVLQYTGHERDTANVGPSPGTAALPDYLHARYYDSSRGRFLSVDAHLGTPSFPQSWNRYAYARSNPLKYVDPNGKDIQLAGVNSTAVFNFLVRTAQHALGRADLQTLARNHSFLATYHDQQINSPQQIANIKAQGGSVTLALTTPDRVVGATKADIAIDTNAVPVLHPDPSGITTTAHEDNHAINIMNGMPWAQIIATDRTGSAEAYGASVAASPTDMTQQQAEAYVTQLLLPAEPPQTLTDIGHDLPPPEI
jgi:RHS repeat-associated protein